MQDYVLHIPGLLLQGGVELTGGKGGSAAGVEAPAGFRLPGKHRRLSQKLRAPARVEGLGFRREEGLGFRVCCGRRAPLVADRHETCISQRAR